MSVSQYLEELFGLSGQVAVVIGGAGELGFALVAGLAKAGAHVVIADLNGEACRGRVEEVEAFGGTASAAEVNVTSRESLEGLLAEALKVTGRVDILVNCAGLNAGKNPARNIRPSVSYLSRRRANAATSFQSRGGRSGSRPTSRK